MSNIRIFVSHRIAIAGGVIDNDLYVPVCCGAVFDDQNPMGILGDDTGDNISQRRMSFCEFTVQYWAWKNVHADYYGLCHYRRYLSFAPKHYKTDEYTMVHVPVLTPASKQKFNLLNRAYMERLILDYDIITSEYAPVRKIPSGGKPFRTVGELWDGQSGVFFERSSIELLFTLIDRMAPEFSRSAREYFSGSLHRGFNCFILKRELFDRLCKFQFPIMFELEKHLNTAGYTQTMLRTPAFLGEMMYGIFMYHVTTKEDWRVKELQLVFYANTEKIHGSFDLIRRYIWSGMYRCLSTVVNPIFPKGTQRRELIKKIFYKITPAKKRGMASG